MEFALDLPDVLPVMALPDTVFFPHAVLPLYIFEPRYQQMLRDTLASHRMFIVTLAKKDSEPLAFGFNPCQVATAGMIRASQKNQDGTSHLILQGLSRVKMVEYLHNRTYPQARINAFHTPPCDPQDTVPLRQQSWELILRYLNRYGEKGKQITPILEKLTAPDAFLDLAVYSLCHDCRLKQQILEHQDLHIRYQLMLHWLNAELQQLDLENELRGRLDCDDLFQN